MKNLAAIAAVPARPGGIIVEQRKIAVVILDADDFDKLQDRESLSVNLEDIFPETGRMTVVFCYHPVEAEAIKAFKESYDLVYFDGRKM